MKCKFFCGYDAVEIDNVSLDVNDVSSITVRDNVSGAKISLFFIHISIYDEGVYITVKNGLCMDKVKQFAAERAHTKINAH